MTQSTRAAQEEDDRSVSAHHLVPDDTSGSEDWHTEQQFGECQYIDEAGYPQRRQAWHRHPFATEYTELYDGR
jgi:hypothetical protein